MHGNYGLGVEGAYYSSSQLMVIFDWSGSLLSNDFLMGIAILFNFYLYINPSEAFRININDIINSNSCTTYEEVNALIEKVYDVKVKNNVEKCTNFTREILHKQK